MACISFWRSDMLAAFLGFHAALLLIPSPGSPEESVRRCRRFCDWSGAVTAEPFVPTGPGDPVFGVCSMGSLAVALNKGELGGVLAESGKGISEICRALKGRGASRLRGPGSFQATRPRGLGVHHGDQSGHCETAAGGQFRSCALALCQPVCVGSGSMLLGEMGLLRAQLR